MEEHSTVSVPFLLETVAFLLTVVILVPTLKRFRISPILGYLAVGAIIGPHALKLVNDVEAVQHFAELGVIFLLFTIGLELSFERLKTFAHLIFGLGAAQVVVSAMVIGFFAYTWGNDWQAATIIGLCLALSSTAMVMQLLNENGELASVPGRTSFAVLLFQDLAVVPILILVSAFGSNGGPEQETWWAWIIPLLKSFAAVAAILLFGHYGLRRVFRIVARTRSTDIFTAMSLLTILATSMVTGLVGLSLALGAFLAGLVLAETEFRYQIESEIEPFKGLFLGLFFMGVGMNLDFVVAFEHGVWVILSVFGLVALKASITVMLARLFRIKLGDALCTGLLLAQGGEFAFVVVGQAAITYNIIESDVAQFMVVVAGLSMILTPALAYTGRKLQSMLEPGTNEQTLNDQIDEGLQQHVIIAGFGRIGNMVSDTLTQHVFPHVAIELDPDIVQTERERGAPVYAGDVTRVELLKRAGVDRAAALLVTLDDPKAAKTVVQVARQHWPQLNIIARTRDAKHGAALRQAGANTVILETLEASLEMSGQALLALGLTNDQTHACIEAARREHLLDA